MRTDMRYKLTFALLFALIPVGVSVLLIFLLVMGRAALKLFPVIVLVSAFILTVILGSLPFFKRHMWLAFLITFVLSAAAGLILRLAI